MLTAQQARDLVAAQEEVAAELIILEEKITEAANLGLFFLEKQMEELLATKVVHILINLGYDATYQSARNLLKIKWS